MRNLFHIQNDDRVKVHSKTTKKIYSTKLQVALSKEDFNNLEIVHDGGFWDSVDWSHEPTENNLDILGERCRQLRDKYDYLILYYSGGSDSETVLQSFLKSRTFLDEIVINRICFNNNDPALLDIELAIQKVKTYIRFMPGTKVTINHVDEKIITDFCNKDRWVGTAFNGTIGMIRRFGAYDFAEYNHSQIYAKGNVGQIYGENKPVLTVRNGTWYNKLSGWGIAAALAGEWFFTSPDLPKLHVKQCYLAKNYWEEYNLPTNKVLGALNDKETSRLKDGRSIRQHLEAACRLPFDQRWQAVKPTGLGNDLRSDVCDNEDSIVYKHMRKYVPNLMNLWNESIVVPMIKEIRGANHLNLNNFDMERIPVREYQLGQ